MRESPAERGGKHVEKKTPNIYILSNTKSEEKNGEKSADKIIGNNREKQN